MKNKDVIYYQVENGKCNVFVNDTCVTGITGGARNFRNRRAAANYLKRVKKVDGYNEVIGGMAIGGAISFGFFWGLGLNIFIPLFIASILVLIWCIRKEEEYTKYFN